MDFNVMDILFDCAVILLATKLLGLLSRRLGLPQVVGMIIAGLLIGPAIIGQFHPGGFMGIIHPTDAEMDVLQSFSQIGVVFILFSSGLETGVLVPVALGTAGALLFMGWPGKAASHGMLMNALFVGSILAATSVGITVETLRELGKLNTRVGTTILSAAIIDDVLGIITLSVITGMNGGGSVGITLLKAAGFFVFTIGAGLLLRWLFKVLVKKYPHRRRTGIFALVMCFMYAFCAEEFFDIAAITGAYMAGLMLSGLDDTSYVDRKVVVSGYMIFTPMFFAYIGISADFSHFRPSGLVFAAVFVLLGLVGKIIGCGGIARLFHYNSREALTIGCGMIARGEVALAVYATGQSMIYYENGVLAGIDPLVATIFLIVLSSIFCPVLLKLVFKNQISSNEGEAHRATIGTEAIENAGGVQ